MRLFNFGLPFNFGHLNSPSPPNFCSCLIYQAQLPNKLGNYTLKQSRLFLSQSHRQVDQGAHPHPGGSLDKIAFLLVTEGGAGDV